MRRVILILILSLATNALNVRNNNNNNCRESARTGSVVLKVVPVTGAALAGHHEPINVRISFPTPTIGMK